MAAAVQAQVCVVGGGPAGLTLALELARRSVSVVVVEQSSRFDRSFRGESISPDSVWLLERMGVLQDLRDQTLETRRLEISDQGRTVLRADFSQYRQPCPFPLELPQPPLLEALAAQGGTLPEFRLLRRTTATALRTEGTRVTGVRCKGPDGEFEVTAALTVGADGRFSKIREMSGLTYRKQPLERDFVWFKVPRPEVWDGHTYRVRIVGARHGLFIPTVPDLVRVGFNIPKGGLKELRAQGIGALHARMDELAPEISDQVRTAVTAWSDTSMLDIFTTVVPHWSRPGLVLVGDAAHTLTPVLGQGVNHAITDAAVLARLVAPALRERDTAAAVGRATLHFQQEREASVARARALQLRQERAFALSGPLPVLLRRAVYRLVDASGPVKRRMLSGIYYPLQQEHRIRPFAVAPVPATRAGAQTGAGAGAGAGAEAGAEAA